MEWWVTCFGLSFRWASPPALFWRSFQYTPIVDYHLVMKWFWTVLFGDFDAHFHFLKLNEAHKEKTLCQLMLGGECFPCTPFSHSVFSSSAVIGSACLTWTPRPLERSCFIAPSKTFLNPEKDGELKGFTCGWWSWMYLWSPQQIAYISPFFLLSKTNLLLVELDRGAQATHCNHLDGSADDVYSTLSISWQTRSYCWLYLAAFRWFLQNWSLLLLLGKDGGSRERAGQVGGTTERLSAWSPNQKHPRIV